MTTIGIRPGDAVLVIERRGEQQLAYNALVAGFTMDDKLAGTHGEPAIEACFVATHAGAMNRYGGMPTLSVPKVVHVSHLDWLEGRAGLAYEELPSAIPGLCRYCRCTEERGCHGGCGWLDSEMTVCTNPECMSKFMEDTEEDTEEYKTS